MSRRILIRAISFLIFAFFVLIAMNIQNMERASRYEQIISDSYYYSLSELLSGAENIKSNLDICVNSDNDEKTALLCAEIQRNSRVVLMAAKELPLSNASFDNLKNFLANTNRFSDKLLRKVISGKKITADEKKKLIELFGLSEELSSQLQTISPSAFDQSNQYKDIQEFKKELEKLSLLSD